MLTPNIPYSTEQIGETTFIRDRYGERIAAFKDYRVADDVIEVMNLGMTAEDIKDMQRQYETWAAS